MLITNEKLSNDRKQYVEIEKYQSDELPITTGVPQGSILGPLLFIIYINDLSFSSNIFKTISYADDTILYVSLTPTRNPIETNQIKLELSNVSKWLDLNKLSLNVPKTKCMLFHTQKYMAKPLNICKNLISLAFYLTII